MFSKKEESWYSELADFEVRDTIQPREYSRGDGKEGLEYKVFAVNVNWNSDNREWNVNDWQLDENDRWNADNQVFSRHSQKFLSPLRWDFCFQSLLPVAEHSSDFIRLHG